LTKRAKAAERKLEQPKKASASELADIFAEFNRTTERLRASHETLRRKVTELSAELAEKNEELRLKSRLAAIGEMAAAVAHEVRNPLGAIELYASLLERDLRDSPQQLALVSKMLAGVKSLEHTVQNLLAFTSPPSLEKKRCDVAELVAEAFAVAVPEPGRSLGFRMDFQPRPLLAEMDADQMERAFVNIIQNAVQAMHDGGTLTVEGRLVRGRPPTVSVSFADTGPGIPSEFVPKVFVPFFSKKENGLGLGLSLAQRVVENHYGRISADNVLPHGALFTIEIPAE